ncbi:MAG: M48 family metallopeptidase [Pseudomonadota bacterium]
MIMPRRKTSPGGFIPLVGILAILLAACATTPYTGRSQLMLIDPRQELSLGAKAYNQVLQKEKRCQDADSVALVRGVGERVAKAAKRPDYRWEFTLIESSQVNAFALPGGKVAVYTGILPYTKTEAGLATVIAHEVAHALARHGAERMSRGLLIQLGEQGLLAAMGTKRQTAAAAVSAAYGLGTAVGVELPFSRAQEMEADHIGLILMAEAGYDPHEAISFWQRMSSKEGGKKPPEFLSTHPCDAERIRQLEVELPEALRYYHPSTDQAAGPAAGLGAQ